MLSREAILKLDILTPDETHARIISATGKQVTLQNSTTGRTDRLLIIKGRGLPEVETGNSVDVIVQMKSGERVKYPSYVTVSTDYQLNVVMKTASSHIMEERRRYYKVDADINCIINAVERGGSRITQVTPPVAQIKDLNIGGIFLCICEEPLQKADILTLTIMMDQKNVDITAEIIRVQTNAAGDVTGYGCRFLNLTPAIEETFAKYVFKVQLDSLKDEDA
ncbi:MAG: PilZ domain-containing protein [Bacteroides sp.]|nr:PilZ domain-containing protein [Bacteroides sp.]